MTETSGGYVIHHRFESGARSADVRIEAGPMQALKSSGVTLPVTKSCGGIEFDEPNAAVIPMSVSVESAGMSNEVLLIWSEVDPTLGGSPADQAWLQRSDDRIDNSGMTPTDARVEWTGPEGQPTSCIVTSGNEGLSLDIAQPVNTAKFYLVVHDWYGTQGATDTPPGVVALSLQVHYGPEMPLPNRRFLLSTGQAVPCPSSSPC